MLEHHAREGEIEGAAQIRDFGNVPGDVETGFAIAVRQLIQFGLRNVVDRHLDAECGQFVGLEQRIAAATDFQQSPGFQNSRQPAHHILVIVPGPVPVVLHAEFPEGAGKQRATIVEPVQDFVWSLVEHGAASGSRRRALKPHPGYPPLRA